MKKLLIALLTAAAFLLSAPAADAARDVGELIVRLEAGLSPERFLADFNGAGRSPAELWYARPAGRRFNLHVFRYNPQTTDGEDLLARLRRRRDVSGAAHNREVEWRATPNDPEFAKQWGLQKIGAPGVWDISTGGTTALGDEIVVAILDSGFDPDHEDIRDNLWINRGEIAGDGIDNDGNGYTDDVTGWNFVDSSAEHRLDQHGISVAGIIGARGDNGIGVSGINWNVKLMLLDIRLVDQIVAAYEYVVDQRERYNRTQGREGALVVATNASFGLSKVFCIEQPIWGAMYDLLGEVGVLTAAGTANSAWDVDEVGDIPTTCPSNFLLTVLNTNELDERHQASAYGKVSIDMGAPGQNSYTTKPFDSYGTFNGNSASAPHLTGAIAFLYSLPCENLARSAIEQPTQTALQIRDILLRGVDPLPQLDDFTATGGRLSLANSVALAQDLCGGTTGPLGILRLFPNPAHEELTLEFETPNFEPYELRVYNALGQEVLRRDITPSRFSVKRETLPVRGLAAGVYYLRLRQGAEAVTQAFAVQR